MQGTPGGVTAFRGGSEGDNSIVSEDCRSRVGKECTECHQSYERAPDLPTTRRAVGFRNEGMFFEAEVLFQQLAQADPAYPLAAVPASPGRRGVQEQGDNATAATVAGWQPRTGQDANGPYRAGYR